SCNPVEKWNNAPKSWQPRYFVLENGILSYYDSQDDVGKGSKGSIKMAVCEIKGRLMHMPNKWWGGNSPL
uniref:PH domain-containing protein n=1 Tax=Pseudonaja textilis TaxID=8673 RepID=A0A670YDX8_PSETE